MRVHLCLVLSSSYCWIVRLVYDPFRVLIAALQLPNNFGTYKSSKATRQSSCVGPRGVASGSCWMMHMQTPTGYYDDGSPGLRHEHDALSRDDVAADHTRAIRVPKQSPDAMMHSSHATMLLRFAAIGIAPAGGEMRRGSVGSGCCRRDETPFYVNWYVATYVSAC